MKGDFTRSTFKPDKHYSSVRMQQGRVQLDADWNEQMDINSYRIETETLDIIGPCGVPWSKDGGGFKIGTTSDDLTISPGRIYVDGILCESFKKTDNYITNQDDLPGYSLPKDQGIYLAYMDVWQRHITCIEDPQIREVALGGPDTATRTKTVWQVKLEKLEKYKEPPEKNGQIDCQAIKDEWKNLIDKSNCQLSAFTNQETPTKNPCIISPSVGYRGLENQLYRVEIHEGGERSKARFKWSRDNGSVVFPIEEFITDSSNNPTNKLKVKQLGRDKTFSLKAGDWVEVLDDTTELIEKPARPLVQITENLDLTGRIITLSQAISGDDFKIHPRIRRWDQQSDAIPVPPTSSDSIELENGIYIRFSGTRLKASDYWLIPARTVTGNIEWPLDGSNNSLPQPPEGIVHHYCLLAVLKQDNSKWTIVSDCRKLFSAVTELTSFFHVCGDGQEAMPGEELPGSLQVGVTNGNHPIKGALVWFKVIDGGGKLSADNPVSITPLIVKTDLAGVAECKWKLGALDPSNPNIPPRQLVEARLLDACHRPINASSIRFNANLSVASQVAYTPSCPNNANVKTVQEALNLLLCGELGGGGGCCVFVSNSDELKQALDELKDGSTICLLPGEFKIEHLLIKDHNKIVIRGYTLGIKLFANIEIIDCENLVIENMDILGSVSIEGSIDHDENALCKDIHIQNANISGSVYIDLVADFSLIRNEFSQANGQNFKMNQCYGAVIESNFFDIYETGLEFTSSSLHIQNNDFYFRSNDEEEDIKIRFENSGLNFQNNSIYNYKKREIVLKFENSRGLINVRDNYMDGVKVISDDTNLNVQNNVIFVNNGTGLIFYKSGYLNIQNNEISVDYGEGDHGTGTGLVVYQSDYLNIQDNRIDITLERKNTSIIGIDVRDSANLKITGNQIGTTLISSEFSAAAGIRIEGLVAKKEELDGNIIINEFIIASNKISTINRPSLEIRSKGRLIRVHENHFTSQFNIMDASDIKAEEGTSKTIKILSPESRIIFTDNVCDSSATNLKDNRVYLINIEALDTIFSNNHCTLTMGSEQKKIYVRHVYIHISKNCAYYANVIGNMCIENQASEKYIISILVGEESEDELIHFAEGRANVYFNIATNLITTGTMENDLHVDVRDPSNPCKPTT